MNVIIDTIPVDGLPQKIFVDKKRVMLVTSGAHADSILLHDEARHLHCELSDMSVDIVWCCTVVGGVIVMGSAYGNHVYFIDTGTLQIKQVFQLLREEDQSTSMFAILVTPDEKHVAIISELTFAITKWSGEILLDFRINLLSDRFLSLTNHSISFEDQSTEKTFTYFF
jgi:hypothetical protein